MAASGALNLPGRLQRSANTRAEARRWAIILAGGEGTRLNAFTTERYGSHRPKQYCSFWGGRTMLQWTLDRTRPLMPSRRIKFVIGKGHESMFSTSIADPAEGEVIVQPKNCGTLPGILLPLSHILAEDAEATVLLLPSDHFIFPTKVFVDRARRAMELAERYSDKLVLLGAVPDAPVPDYGWVQPAIGSERLDDWEANAVSAFIEKPEDALARSLYRNHWLWNTMIVAAKAKLMWNAAFECEEELSHRFNAYRRAVAAVRAGRAPAEHGRISLTNLYRNLGSVDFSRDLLQRVPDRCTILPLRDMYWCDCGHPDRLSSLLNTFTGRDDVRDDIATRQGSDRALYAGTARNQ